MWKSFKNPLILFPIIIFLVMVLSFGLMTFDLGFYLDDWPNIFFEIVKGSNATHLFHAYDGRPLQGFYQIFLFKIFGTTTWAWQIFAFFIRFLSVIFTWLIFRKLWPKAEFILGVAAILFSVYPIFAQQPMAITFMVHWTSLLCVMLSIYLMLQALSHPKYYGLLTILAMAISGVGLILIEYFVGLELLRPLFIYLVLTHRPLATRQRAIKTAIHFTPYLFVLILYITWRVFLINLPVPDRNSLVMLDRLRDAPLETVVNFFLTIIQDLIHLLVAGWYKTFEPGIFRFTGVIDIFSVILAGLIAVGLYFGLRKISITIHSKDLPSNIYYQMIFVGLAIILLGALPGWLIGRQVSAASGLWADRFGMASMSGAALVITILLWRIVKSEKIQILILAIMVGLASGWQIRNTNEYRWSWEYQKRVFNQFMWRMPYIMPDTLILSTYEYFPKMGHYPTAFALNTIYPQTRDDDQVDFWYSPIPRFFGGNWGDFLDGSDFSAGHWQAFFRGHTKKSIIADYRKEQSRCVWVLGPEDSLHPLIDETTRESLGNSDLSRIARYPVDGYPKYNVVPEMTKTWCYYFQKADLAAQYGDWAEVVHLWEESRPTRRQMNASTELAPFIKGLVRTKNFDEAAELTMQMKTTVVSAEPYLCKIWQDAINSIRLDSDEMAATNEVLKVLQCNSLTPGVP